MNIINMLSLHISLKQTCEAYSLNSTCSSKHNRRDLSILSNDERCDTAHIKWKSLLNIECYTEDILVHSYPTLNLWSSAQILWCCTAAIDTEVFLLRAPRLSTPQEPKHSLRGAIGKLGIASPDGPRTCYP